MWAELYRAELSKLWLGRELPAWREPCEIKATYSKTLGSGSTNFGFGSTVTQSCSVDGRPDRVLYDVLPHEITHMVFANAIGRPLPRWADEGGATYAESDYADQLQIDCLKDFANRPVFSMRGLFSIREYPPDNNQVKMLYAMGYGVSKHLIELKDRPTFLNFVADGMNRGWDAALQSSYGISSCESLQKDWYANCYRKRQGCQTTQQAQPRPRQGILNIDIGPKQAVVVPQNRPSVATQPVGTQPLIPPPAKTPDAPTTQPYQPTPDVTAKLDKAIAELGGMQAKIDAALANLKDGADGKPGKDGANGKDGAPGKDGLAGLVGPRGLPGADGKEGPRGLAGADGKAGVNGLDGKPGAAGKDGANGKDADPAMVASAVQDALSKQPPMTCILKDAQGNVINTETFGPNKPLIIRLIPVTPAK